MLRLAFWGGLAALLTAGALPARAEEGANDAKAIVAKAIEARGGGAAIEKYKAGTSKFKGTFHGMGDAIAMKGTSKEQAPDKMRLEVEMNAGGMEITFVQIFNGNKGWFGLNGNFMELGKEMIDEAREQMHASQVTDLRLLTGTDVQLKTLGESKVGDATAVGVRVSQKGYRDIDLFFDKDKGYLIKSETKGNDVQGGGGEFKSESLYSDYKKSGELTVPHKVKVLRDGKPFLEMEMSEVTPAEKLDAKDFAEPKAS
jgi:hypothetical protein